MCFELFCPFFFIKPNICVIGGAVFFYHLFYREGRDPPRGTPTLVHKPKKNFLGLVLVCWRKIGKKTTVFFGWRAFFLVLILCGGSCATFFVVGVFALRFLLLLFFCTTGKVGGGFTLLVGVGWSPPPIRGSCVGLDLHARVFVAGCHLTQLCG